MFLDLFYGLRAAGVPVAIQEWQAFLTALERGLHGSSLLRFYHLGRSCLVKSETYFDAYDRVFAKVFRGVEGALGDEVNEQVLEWLQNPKNFPNLSPEELAALERLTNDELMRRFLETLAEQNERHDGGGRWVGTGGKSPFGHGGQHPTGIRVGGKSQGRSAMKVAEERRFRDYRTDQSLDIRQLKTSLRRLRQLTRMGPASELDLDSTIDETCRNAGEIELVFQPPAAKQRPPAVAHGRRRDNGPVLRAGEPSADRATRGPQLAGVRALLLPQLHLRLCVHAGAHGPHRCRSDRRHPTPSRQSLAGHHHRRRRDAPGRAYGTAWQHRSTPHLVDAGNRLAPANRGAFRARHLDQSRSTRVLGRLPHRPHRAPPLSDVSPERRRHHRRPARPGRIENTHAALKSRKGGPPPQPLP